MGSFAHFHSHTINAINNAPPTLSILIERGESQEKYDPPGKQIEIQNETEGPGMTHLQK
jgi:hypothetical protein